MKVLAQVGVSAPAPVVAIRGKSLDYADHQGALHKISKRGFGVLQSAHVGGIQYEDVFQVVSEGYAKALKAFKPELGYQFNTYFFHACQNTMARFVGNLIREQIAVGHFQLPASPDEDEDDQEYALNRSGAMQDHDDPSVILERKQEMARKIRQLSPSAKMIVGELMNPGTVTQKAMEVYRREAKVHDICRVIGMDERTTKRTRAELTSAYGVTV